MEQLNYKEEIERRINKISFFKDGIRLSKNWDELNCLLSKLEGYTQGRREAIREIQKHLDTPIKAIQNKPKHI